MPAESLDKTQRRILLLTPRSAVPGGPPVPDGEGEKPVCPVDPEGGVLGKLGCLNVLLLLLLLIAALNS